MTDTNNGFTPTEKMLDPTNLALMLRISDRHLTDVRTEDPTFPAPRMLGSLPRWSPAAIHRWMDGATTDACGRCRPSDIDPVVVTNPKGSKKEWGAQRVH